MSGHLEDRRISLQLVTRMALVLCCISTLTVGSVVPGVWSPSEFGEGPDLGGFVAYNDLSWAPGQLSSNITRYTTPAGTGQRPDGSSGPLVDYKTGQPVPALLSVTGGRRLLLHASLGNPPRPHTDAYTVFNGKVDLVGEISYGGGDVELVFSNLNPCMRYNVVVYGNRGKRRYRERLSKTTIVSADSFRNESTKGSVFSHLLDSSATIRNGYNTKRGHVARFTHIDPGTDGEFRILQSDGGSMSPPKHYINAVCLEAYEVGEAYVAVEGDDEANNCSDSDNPCLSLQHAVDEVDPGGVVYIDPGVYTEQGILIDKDLSLIGASAQNTFVQASEVLGEASNRVFQIRGGIVVLKGLTIQHGHPPEVRFTLDDSSEIDGGGIKNFGSLTLWDVCVIKNSTEVLTLLQGMAEVSITAGC